MTAPETSLIQRLCEAEKPRDLDRWQDQDGHYVAACRVSADDVPGLIGIVRKWGDPEWPHGEGEPLVDRDGADLLPVTAWRALADLKAGAAVEPLIDILRALDDGRDDWVTDELPHVFGKIGEPTVQPLTRVATDHGNREYVRSIAVCGLRRVAHYHADARDRIIACLTEMMANAADDDLNFNTTVMAELVELHAVGAAESIERAFAGNFLDAGLRGNWEVVRRRLGVEGLGLAMPANPHNSLEQFRRRMGYGVFSDRPVFLDGDIDDDAADAYYERAFETFSRSSEAQQAIDRHGELFWFQTLLEFGLNYRGETVDEMTRGSVVEFVLDYVPRKVSTDADSAASIIGELSMFWKYLNRVYKLPAARAIVEWLDTGGRVAELETELSDSSNFGMAKSFFMLGNDAGYDMTSKGGMAEFTAAYNRLLSSHQSPPPRSIEEQPIRSPLSRIAPAAPAVREQRVGRNEPCPCGSGKKFKKCCGRSSQQGSAS